MLVLTLAAGPGRSNDLHQALTGELRSWTQEKFGPLGCETYVVSERMPDPDIDDFSNNRGWAPAGDVLVQFHFSEAASDQGALQSLNPGALPPTVLGCCDPGRSTAFLADEVEIFSSMPEDKRWSVGEGGPVKMVVANWKRPDLSYEEYLSHWSVVHADLVRVHGPAMGFCRYVQSRRTEPDTDLGAALGWASAPDGGLTEVWWSSHAAMKVELSSAKALAASALFAVDEQQFVFPERMSAFLARETRVALH